MNKLLVICGPTATGKTSLGIKLAKKLNGEIISADSRQVYRGMDIGTGKEINKQISKFHPEPEQSSVQGSPVPSSALVLGQISNLPAGKAGQFQMPNNKSQIGYYLIDKVKIWLYDVIEPDQRFSAGEYAKLTWLVIEDIWKRGRLPILVGGTGFYIKAVVEGIGTINIPPDWKLREKLRYYDIEILRYLLRELDPKRLFSMNQSDRNNPRRLIRAIEIALKNQKSKLQIKNQNYKSKIKNLFFIGLTASRKILYERIDKRVEERVKAGIVEEIKGLLKKGYSWKDPGFNTLGYKQWRPFFEGKASKEDVVQKWKYAEHAYARRQLTWFKKEKRLKWYIVNSWAK